MTIKGVLKTTLLNSFQWVVFPIRAGELKGKWWTVSSSSKFLRGKYETRQIARFKQHLGPGQVVYDLGAHMGYYTLVASQCVGAQGRVFAFEPFPFNFRQLQRHVKLNKCANVTTLNTCVGEEAGTTRFTSDSGSGTNRVSTEGALEVEVASIDSLVANATIPPPDVIKMDVEGSEFSALKGARSVIEEARPLLFISFHGAEVKQQCSSLLESWDYKKQGAVWVPNRPTDKAHIQ